MIGSNFPVAGANAARAVQQNSAITGTSGQTRSANTTPNLLSYLTPGDRELIAKATGVKIGADGINSEGTGTAPIVAWMIAGDRQSGVLPAGEPITSIYLSRFGSSGDASYAELLSNLKAEVAKRGDSDRLDLRL